MISVVNWKRHQHYGKSKPPWIKLYRDALGQYELMFALEAAERWVVVGLWMLAAEFDNAIPAEPEFLTHRLRYTVDFDLIERLQHLGFIEVGALPSATLEQSLPQTEERRDREEAEENNAREARSLVDGFNEVYRSAPSGPLMTAEAEYHRALERTDHPTIARRWPEYVRRQKADGLNVPHLANWLRRGGWADPGLDERTKSMAELLEGTD